MDSYCDFAWQNHGLVVMKDRYKLAGIIFGLALGNFVSQYADQNWALALERTIFMIVTTLFTYVFFMVERND